MFLQPKASQLKLALAEFLSLRSRAKHPAGHFAKNGSWHSSEVEACCAGIRTPSRAYPYSEMVHCRSAKHVAATYGVDEEALKYEIRLVDAGTEADESKALTAWLKRVAPHSAKNKKSGYASLIG